MRGAMAALVVGFVAMQGLLALAHERLDHADVGHAGVGHAVVGHGGLEHRGEASGDLAHVSSHDDGGAERPCDEPSDRRSGCAVCLELAVLQSGAAGGEGTSQIDVPVACGRLIEGRGREAPEASALMSRTTRGPPMG
jgi:hypothetical protein